jgi:type IV fimbrial biogenesis protein FimT
MYLKHGFTLAELMVAIAIAGILVALGVPSYLGFVERNAISTTSNELLGGLLLARSEAVRQEASTTFTPEDDGWLVQSGDVTLLDHTVTSDHIVISGDTVTYSARGRAGLDTTGSINISYKDTLVSRVCLSLSGRPFIKLVKDGDCP